ncbi:conserved hypothetical protein [Clostridium botulinum C str. Eklund]|nr:conserved hypothetical protein [Clostridium botulinum C str. Eklund]
MIYKTKKNTPLVEKIISSTISSNSLSYSIQTHPSNGYASINQEGIFKYTPKVNFLGTDKFSILINNADIGSITLDVSILVVNEFSSFSNEFPYCKL